MPTYAHNPIRERLQRADAAHPAGWSPFHKGFPSEAAARWLGAGVGVLIGAGSTLIESSLSRPDDWSIRLGSEPLIVVVCLATCFVLSAGMMAGEIGSGDYALLRLSAMTPEAMVEGYSEGFAYRLRLLRALAVWSPVGWAGWLLITLPPQLATVLTCGMIVVVTALAVIVGQMMVRSLTRLMVSAGVWFGLRVGRHAGVMAAGIGALVGSVLVVSLGVVLVPGLFRCCAPMLAVILLVALDNRRAFFTADAIRAVQTNGWPPDHPEMLP
jgi:hypothetical protein